MKRIFSLKKVFLFLALILGAVLVTSCGGTNKVLDSITVSTEKAKTTYNEGDQFSKDGLVVTAVYTDKTTKEVTNYQVDSSNFVSTAGTYDITVTYKEKDITKTATYIVTVNAVVADHLVVNTDNATTVFVKGDEFSSNGITISIVFSNGEEGSYAANDFEVDSSAYKKDVIGEYTIKVTLNYGGKELVGTYTVIVESNEVLITTVDQFLEMRSFTNANGENPKIYRLGTDLDLTGVTLEPVTSTFTGKFDGQGHTIKNATYVQSGSKEGMLFKKVKGATIENVKFFACAVIGGASETVSMIAGECNETGVTFNNIEFSCCSVDNQSQNYAALLIGRNESKTVEIIFNEITVKNMTSVKSKQYVGGLIGDIIKDTSIVAKNCDIDITLSASNSISVFSGRNRGGSVTVENSIVRASIGAATTSSTNQCGVFADGNSSSTITATNVAILKFEMQGEYSINADLLYGRNNNTNATFTNVHYVNDNGSLTTADTTATGVAGETVTSDYLMDTVKLGDKFEKDETKLVKLINASANTPSKDATITSLVLVTSTCNKLFFVGDEFSSEGLIVTAIYSDGCVVAMSDYNLEILNSQNQVVSADDFKTAPTGVYTIKATSGTVSEAYRVDLVVVDDITIDPTFVQKIFLTGDTFNATDLIVFRELTNGAHQLVNAKDYEVTVDALTNVGDYEVTVSYMTFTKTYIISVVEDKNEYLTDIEVLVKDTVTTPTVEEGKYVFGTINEAIDYLTALNLDDQVIKTIKLDGTFEENVTIALPNVVLIGTASTKAVITSGNASGTVTKDELGTYGTDDSATVIITSKAVGFTAKNIMFVNSFDYNNSTLANRQALAVRCDADMSTFYQCGFTGYQDTLEAKMGRQYYYECQISGAVDFIFGNNATAVFESCEIKALTRFDSKGEPDDNNGYVCATKGYSTASGTDTVTYNYVFMNCNFTAEDDVVPGSMSIARPWGTDSSVVTIKCTFSNAYSTLPYGGKEKSRYADMSGNLPTEAKFYEYQNTGAGSISEEVAGMRFLTDDEAAAYTLENIFAKENGQKDYGTTWNVVKDPALANETLLIYYYTLGKTEYDNKAEYVESTIKAFTLTGNKLTGFAVVTKDLTEVIVDKDGNTVDSSELTTTAGTYTIKLMDGETVLEQNEVTVEEPAGDFTEVTTTYTFDVKNLAYEGVADKDDLAQSEVNEYFTISGEIDKRIKKDDAGLATAISSVEVAKAGGSYFEFTITGTAKVTIEMSSTGGSNTSAVGIQTADGTLVANAENITTITGTTKTTMTYELEAGTYRVVSPLDAANSRGARLYSIVVEETVKVIQEPTIPVTTTYTFDVKNLAYEGVADKDGLAQSEVNEYFTISGAIDKRIKKDDAGVATAISSVEVAKAGGSYFEFTITGTAKVTIEMSSTGGSNTSAVGLQTADGTLVENAENITTITGTTKTTMTYELEAGTYRVVSPEDAANSRGARLYSIVVEETK